MSEKARKSFDKMYLIMSPTNNHGAYRRLLRTVSRKDPCIPYFGQLLWWMGGGGRRGREGVKEGGWE